MELLAVANKDHTSYVNTVQSLGQVTHRHRHGVSEARHAICWGIDTQTRGIQNSRRLGDTNERLGTVVKHDSVSNHFRPQETTIENRHSRVSKK